MMGLMGTGFAVSLSDLIAAAIGCPRAPIDNRRVFNIASGRTVADLLRNLVADLGYGNCRFPNAVYPAVP